MTITLEHAFIFAAIFFLNIELSFSACARAEYEINKECCPMCAPGTHVYRHCTEFVSTTCVPCIDSFTSKPNGLSKCFTCAVCDHEQGLKIKSACTPISDTVCEAREGLYCTNYEKGSCTQAVEHTKCIPGQYIKQKGTSDKDTECVGCKNGTYSDGLLENCKQHTKCEDLGRREIKPGSSKSDAECGNKISSPIVNLIVGIIIFIALVAVALVLFKFRHKIFPCPDRKPEKEQGKGNDEEEQLQ